MHRHANVKDAAKGDPQPVLASHHPSVEPAPGPSLPPAASLVAHNFSAIPVVPEGSLEEGLAPKDPDPAPPSAGGARVHPLSLHPKLAISQPGDPPEEEADRAADQVLGGAVLQRKPAGGEAQVTAPARPGGQELDPATRALLEPRFGFDFGRVRIHADAEAAEAARSVNAHAYTLGSDIVFGAGRYAPESPEGQRLLAHELAHVVQQGAAPGRTVIQRQAAPTPAAPPAGTTGAAPTGGLPPGVKLSLPPAPGAGALVRHTGTQLTFTDNAEYDRYQLEEYVNKNGLDSLKRFEGNDELFILGEPNVSLGAPQAPAPDSTDYLKRVRKTVHDEIVSLRVHIGTFREDFQRRANDTLATVLNDSKARIEKELERYGIKQDKTTVLGLTIWTSYSSSDPVGTKGLADDARALQAKLGPVLTAKGELDQVSKTTTKDDYNYRKAIWEGPHNKYEAALKEYNDLRKKLENGHPMVMAYNLDALSPSTPGHLAKLGSETGSDRAEHVGEELHTRLKNIEKVRTKAGDDKAYVWKLERIVGVTRELPDIKNHRDLKHRGLQASVVIEKVAEGNVTDELIAIGTGIVIFGLGLIAAAPTGGLSLAGAAAVSAAGTAEAVLLIASAYNAYQKYELDSAANATDYDAAKVISQEAPNLFWLALDLVGAFKAVKGGLKSASALFQQVNALKEEALTAKAMKAAADARGVGGAKAPYDHALEELESAGEKAKPGAGKRLRKEVENDAGDARSRGSSAVDPDAEPVTMRNPLGSAANLGPESKGFTRAEAVNEYFRIIQANPDIEYAVIQHAQTKRFAVVTGTIDRVKVPASLGDDWHFVRHYHPNLTADEAGGLAAIPRDTKKGVFGARFPSVFGPQKSPGDVLGARISSIERGNNQVSETIDWFEPETNRMRTSRFGYNPNDAATPYWVEITTRAESTLKGKFASAKDAQLWIWSIDELRAPTPRGAVPATK